MTKNWPHELQVGKNVPQQMAGANGKIFTPVSAHFGHLENPNFSKIQNRKVPTTQVQIPTSGRKKIEKNSKILEPEAPKLLKIGTFFEKNLFF